MDFPINKPGTVTDADFLYRSLGSFWNDVFQDKDVLKGYTKGQAEEITQRYLDLIEAINSYSVDKVDIFHRECWKPLYILRSNINEVPFTFKPNDAVFGAQPNYSQYYNGLTFKFGEKKSSNEKVYQYYVGKDLAEFSVIADRIIAPNKLYIYGTDVILDQDVLVFNKNVFEDPLLTRTDVFDADGNPVTFIDGAGETQPEQRMILWVYNGLSDVSNLYKSFGYVFKLNQAGSSFYKAILQCLVRLFINGPTVGIMKKLMATFAKIPSVLNDSEIVEQVFADNNQNYVVTDKEVYKVSNTYSLIPLQAGQVLAKGDILCSNIQFFDNLTGALGWWKRTGLINKQLSFSRCLFYGNYLNQLSFSTEADLVTLNASGEIVFPVIGDPADVKTFNAYLNADSTRQTTIKNVFGLVDPGDSHLVFPLDFVMDNFLKQNTSFFDIDLPDHEVLAEVLELIPLFKSSLPPYVYLIVKIKTTVDSEVYSSLNGEFVDIAFTDDEIPNVSADGTNLLGELEKLAPFYFNDVSQRLIEIDKALPTQPFEMVTSTDSSSDSDAKMITGVLRKTPNAGDTSAEFNKFLFLDFL